MAKRRERTAGRRRVSEKGASGKGKEREGCCDAEGSIRDLGGYVGRSVVMDTLPANPVTAPPSSFYIFATTRRHHRPTILSRTLLVPSKF